MNDKSNAADASARADGSADKHASQTETADVTESDDVTERTDVSTEAAPQLPIEKRTARFRVAAGRENVEALVVAFILALIFRAFLAEAFVIPTGSMAPTLMGAHKDLFCDRCEFRFPAGASHEGTPLSPRYVVGGVCPNCRHLNSLDLRDEPNHDTFNGDRIVVNKYSYALGDPQRWDVIVFKYPGNPKQNYIKRLVGLPNETIQIQHGDLYRSTTGTAETPSILRKDPARQLAMSHHVHDTDFQSAALIQAQYPSRWQPWDAEAGSINETVPPTDSWQIDRSDGHWSASLRDAGASPRWLRYFHRWAGDDDFQAAEQGISLAGTNPYQSRAITDFYGYNSSIKVDANRIYKQQNNQVTLREDYEGRGDLFKLRPSIGLDLRDRAGIHDTRNGVHWVGDLMVTADMSTAADAKTAIIELVEAGVQYQAVFNLAKGTVQLLIIDGDRSVAWPGGTPTAAIDVQQGESHQIRFSNYDDALTLWVDGDVVKFDQSTQYDGGEIRTPDRDRPYITDLHPLDASPVGIAIDGDGVIDRIIIQRDQYYIATKTDRIAWDYDRNKVGRLPSSNFRYAIQDMLCDPQAWESFNWASRRNLSFELNDDQYFPMGDNSPGSLDARMWAGTKPSADAPPSLIADAQQWRDDHFVTRNLLVGRAVAIFWPHSWNRPVPYTPNWRRMGLIR